MTKTIFFCQDSSLTVSFHTFISNDFPEIAISGCNLLTLLPIKLASISAPEHKHISLYIGVLEMKTILFQNIT